VRKLLFWLHLSFGVLAGTVILIMCVTGALLMYERQIVAFADREFRSVPTGPRLDPETLLTRLAETERALPVSLTLTSDPQAPAEIALPQKVVYLDAYSGRILGQGSQKVRKFFRSVTDWHRWLAMDGVSRPTGRAITGAANLAFLLIVLGGIYLWMPRRWSWASVRAVLLFRAGLSGKARDFNWHNVIGIWSAIPLVFVVLGSLVISYPWATAFLYRVTGNEPPEAAAPPRSAKATRPFTLTGLRQAWLQAERQVPDWQTITFRIPASDAPRLSLSVAESHRGRPDKRSTITVDRVTGQVVEHETFSGYNAGRRLRMYLRFVHTGELFGVAGQTVAGLVSAGGAVLVWTGIALALRRFRTWRRRTRDKRPETVAVGSR
jgi:uncharacterized iron-regulated membrane protein